MSPDGPSGRARPLRPPDPLWVPPSQPRRDVVAALAAALRLPETICSILAVRGITDVDEAKRFLRPRLDHLHEPSSLRDGHAAAERIVRGIHAREMILVHGDYDVDGICATALLTRRLRELGARVTPFVPHRTRDGYDFTSAGLVAARDAGATLIVTADCGTVAHATVALARAEGIDVVVTDHHSVAGPPPSACAVVNPQRPDCPYPGKELCGTGVAYKLCELVGAALGADAADLQAYLDLVALATVADLVPLSGENRVLVSYGLRRFAHTRVLGLAALLKAAGVPPDQVTAGRLGFVIAPRINAVGRIGDADDALRLLLTEDEGEAMKLADHLEVTNRHRQEEDRRTVGEALDRLGAEFDPETHFGVVLAEEGWHPGVIGIVASRVAERVHRPVVLIALDGERGRGSARSVPGFHLYEALSVCAGHLERFGGHRQAAGMDIRRASVEAFREAFNTEARTRFGAEDLRPRLRPDLELSAAEVDLELLRWLRYLGPHGIGNPAPLFQSRGVSVAEPRVVGQGHLKAVLQHGGARLEAIGFGLAERFPVDGPPGGAHDALYRLDRNEWRGRARPQARLVDLRPATPHADGAGAAAPHADRAEPAAPRTDGARPGAPGPS